jgi:sugar phosphate isomerase/epimerase
VATRRRFGVSTRLFQSERLVREHLLEIASHGFTSVELLAQATHFDYRTTAAVAELQQWLGEAGLDVTSVHVPADDDAEAALLVGRRLPFRVLVVQVGPPRAAARLVERLAGLAGPLGVAVAIDSSSMTPPASLAHFVEEATEAAGLGACLDFGRAHADGDLVDAIETVSGHLVATHVHDSRGRSDQRLVPFDGTIDWASAMTAVQKIGYDGALTFDPGAQGAPRATLKKLQRARQRLETLLET